MSDYSNIGAVCRDCATKAGYTPKLKAVGVWLDECGICHKRKPCTDLRHDWIKQGETEMPMPTPHRMTKESAIDYANTIADPKTVGRIRLVLDQFVTMDDFLCAAESKGALMAAYNKARPGGKRGVGRKLFDAIDRIKAFAMRSETQGLPVTPPPQEQPVKPAKFYTVQQLKALVSFMELCGVKAIDLAVVDEFSKVMKFDVFKAMGCEEGGAQ